MKYHVDKPYPTPKVVEKNEEYANILLHSYAGSVSELTAIHQYLYQSFLLENHYHSVLEQISIVEMHHLELLAETIKLLGKDPKYEATSSCSGTIPWTTTNVPYPSEFVEMITLDLHSEKMAIRNYQMACLHILDPYIQVLLERIIEDEKLHIQIFEQLLQEFSS